jgi:hypothetical protein
MTAITILGEHASIFILPTDSTMALASVNSHESRLPVELKEPG